MREVGNISTNQRETKGGFCLMFMLQGKNSSQGKKGEKNGGKKKDRIVMKLKLLGGSNPMMQSTESFEDESSRKEGEASLLRAPSLLCCVCEGGGWII